MDPVQGWFWYQEGRGGDTPLYSMGGLNKAKSQQNRAINKWGGNTYLALKSNRTTGMQLIRENI